MSRLQQGMLFHSSFAEDAETYHDVLTLTFEGEFGAAELENAVNDSVRAHPVLRTAFDLTTFSEPMQLVHGEARVRLEVHDLTALNAVDATAAVREWAEAEQRRGFDWSTPPLLRAHAHVLPAGRFALTLSFHHAILDGWSVATLTTEVIGQYRAHLDGSALPVLAPEASFRDFVAREREALSSPESGAYWRSVLENAPFTRIPRDEDEPATSETGSALSDEVVPDAVAQRLAQIAADLRVPLRTVLLAAHIRVLALIGGDREILTGVLVNGRPETEDSAAILGLFLNVAPFRLALERESWASLVRRVFAAEGDMVAHRLYPMFELQRLAERPHLAETVFDYRDFHAYDAMPDERRFRLVDRRHRESTDVPLGVSFVRTRKDGGRLHRYLSFARSEFTEAQIAQLHRRYAAALEHLAEDPDGPAYSTAPFLGDGRSVLAGPGADLDTARTLDELVHEQACRRPDAIAVVDQSGSVSYRALLARAHAVADRLRAAGVQRGDCVGVHVPRSADFVVAILGTFIAGAAVVPLEVDYPVERLKYALGASGATALVATSDHAATLAFEGPCVLVEHGEESEPWDVVADSAPGPGRCSDEPAYVMFTSGSTGTPKGVVLPHRALANYLLSMTRSLAVRPDDRIAQRSPAGFDASLFEVMLALLSGATAVIVEQDAVMDPEALKGLLDAQRISMLLMVPSLLASHVDAETFAGRTSLRTVLCAGEALAQHLADRFAAQSGARLVNLYGPTEAGIGVTERSALAGERRSTVPIGSPGSNVWTCVLDEHGQVQPVGAPGELHVGGIQLAHGYIGAPALTADRFVPDHVSGIAGARLYRTGDRVRLLAKGELEFLGRLDGQLKVNGVRVEPAEVEAVIQCFPDIAHAAVTVVERDGAAAELQAHVVWTEDAAPDTDARLRAYLRTRLHPAMVPRALIRIPEMPVLPNGKIDRRALAAAPRADAPNRVGAAPRDLLEARLVELWAELLERGAVGIHDDFFDLGGHSLVALRMAVRIKKSLGREVTTRTILTLPTIAQLAAAIREPADSAGPADEVIALGGDGPRPPLFLMHGLGGDVFRYRPLGRRLGVGGPVYAIPAHGLAEGETPYTSLPDMADEYVRRIRTARPRGPYLVGGFCIGGNIALEVARRLRAQGEQVPLVVMFWSNADQPVLRDSLTDDTTLMARALAGGAADLDLSALRGCSASEQLAAILTAAHEHGQLRITTTDLDEADRLLAVYRANAHAVGWHQTTPYDGDVLVLMPEDDPALAGIGTAGWEQIVLGRLEVRAIPGTRSTSVREPLVGETAALLDRCLAEFG